MPVSTAGSTGAFCGESPVQAAREIPASRVIISHRQMFPGRNPAAKGAPDKDEWGDDESIESYS